ncbi:hypothetical protein IFR05_000804 [Cadophora sp. M221]|nr:hypothetical protein IFR05_000804 [Cadophora sp. M221]
MGVVGELPMPGWLTYNRALPSTTWGKAHGLRRAKGIAAWRRNRQYTAQLREAKVLSRPRWELSLEQKTDRDKLKDVAQDGSGQLSGANIPLQSSDIHAEKRGASASRAEMKEERFRQRYTNFKQFPRLRYSRELLRPCTSDDELPPSVKAMKARYDNYQRKNYNHLQASRKTTTIWQVSRRSRCDDAGNVVQQIRRKRIPQSKFSCPSVARFLKKLELLQVSISPDPAGYRYFRPRKPLRLFSTSGKMFDSVLPRLSRIWIQEALRVDESDLDIEEEPTIEVQKTPRKNKRFGKLYRGIRYRFIGGKLVSLAKNVRHLPDTTWRHLVRKVATRLTAKPNRSNFHAYDNDSAFTKDGRAVQRMLLQIHHKRLRMSLQGPSYAAARLEGVIVDDPNPMPHYFDDWGDIGPYYEELEAREGFVGLDHRHTIIDMRKRADLLWVQAGRVYVPDGNRNHQSFESAEDSIILNDAGEGPSSTTPGMLRRCDRIDLNLLRRTNGYESDEDGSLSDIENSTTRSSKSSDTIRRRQYNISNISSNGSISGTLRNESDEHRGRHMSVESRLVELAETDKMRKLELAKEISSIGSGLLVQEEFKDLVSPEVPSNSQLAQSPEISHAPASSEVHIYWERNDAGTALTRPSERQEKFPDFQLYHRAKPSVTDRDECIAIPHKASFLGSAEEEIAMRNTLQRFDENGIQPRSPFVGRAETTLRQAPVGLDLSNNPDFSIGPPRKRFNTNVASTQQGRAATMTRFAQGRRQDPSVNNVVHEPINQLSSSPHPAMGERGTPDLGPRPGLIPLKLVSQRPQPPSREHRSSSAPYQPRVTNGNTGSDVHPQQSYGLGIGIGLGLAMGSRTPTQVPETLHPGPPGFYANNRSSEAPGGSRIRRTTESHQSTSFNATSRVQIPGTLDSCVDDHERERIEGNGWRPSVPQPSHDSFQLLRPGVGEIYPDYQRRMFKPRAPTIPVLTPQALPAEISIQRANRFPIVPSTGYLWTKAREERIGLGLGDHAVKNETAVDVRLSRRLDEPHERKLALQAMYSTHVDGPESGSEAEAGNATGSGDGDGDRDGAAVDVPGRHRTRRFRNGTTVQPLRLANQIGSRSDETDNLYLAADADAGGAGTTRNPQASTGATEAQISRQSNSNSIWTSTSTSISNSNGENQHQRNADAVPEPHLRTDQGTCINTSAEANQTAPSAAQAAQSTLTLTTGSVPGTVTSRSRFPAGPRPLPPRPRPRARPLPLPGLRDPLHFRPLPPLPVRPSSPFPLLSTSLPPTSPLPSSLLKGPRESTAPPGSLASPASPIPGSDMEHNRLTVRSPEVSQIRLKAMDDARQMQVKVMEECKKAKKEPPPYVLEELIGKGSFGRVYKGKSVKTAAVVAVKIIDIDESDTISPRNADSYSEFLKEVNALRLLGEKNAKNINLVIEALPVNQAMWMITEYCGGGSVATLMKPTAPGGLNEKWIIPILREVAEAIAWVHEAGIIHRDIKCANVLVTEEGNVQLCDFGVAGMIESKLDKRSTIIGTPHWMAPELFGHTPSYGSEVDIWAFGSMIFEVATGLPPNVADGVTYDRLGSHLRNNTPRLEGGNYSNNLRRLVAFCLEEDPNARPTIGEVQKHPYILNTSSSHPTSTLKVLVGSFKVWESRGGSRKSLFMQHGAQGSTPALVSQDDEWNFNGTEYFEDNVWGQYGVKDVIEAYGPGAVGFVDETTRPPAKVSRRRPPPEALSRFPAAPLEKIFDPNTLTSYEDNSTTYYGRPMPQLGPSDKSDLPLRDDSAQISIRDTMIDLGGHDPETGLSSFPDMGTIKAGRRGRDESEDEYNSTLHDFSRPALSDPAETNNNRRTQDWKFPSMAPPASADPELSRFPTTYEVPRPLMTPGSGGRPALIHHPTEPVGAFGGGLAPTAPTPSERLSMRESLIDLDMSMPDPIPEFRRPSTANSDVGSATSEQMTSGNPFELERHASLYQPIPVDEGREPSIYVSDETVLPASLRNGNVLQELAEMSDFSASDAEGSNGRIRRDMNAQYEDSDDSYYVVNPGPSQSRAGHNRIPQYDGADDRDHLSMPPPPVPSAREIPLPRSDSFPTPRLPDLPAQPSRSSLTGSASPGEMSTEITRIVAAMSDQLDSFKNIYDSSDVVQRTNSNRRIDRRESGTQ